MGGCEGEKAIHQDQKSAVLIHVCTLTIMLQESHCDRPQA